MKDTNLSIGLTKDCNSTPLQVFTLKLSESQIHFLRNNPDGIKPSTYLRNLLINDIAMFEGVNHAS